MCEEWHLSLDDERIAAGAWGVVAWCHTESGLEAALKLCANEQRLSAETNAMLGWGGHPAVRVLAHRPGALLLERARPGRPSRLAPSRLALLLDALHRPTSSRRQGLGDWRTSVDAAVTHVPSLQTLGQALLKQGERRPAVALHGDLQPANILEHLGTIVVIDPVGIAGPRELDVANAALQNNWGEDSLSTNQAAGGPDRHRPGVRGRLGPVQRHVRGPRAETLTRTWRRAVPSVKPPGADRAPRGARVRRVRRQRDGRSAGVRRLLLGFRVVHGAALDLSFGAAYRVRGGSIRFA